LRRTCGACGQSRLALRSHLLLLWSVVASIGLLGSPSHANYEQRATYFEAREKLRQGNTAGFRKLARSLENYSLRPYLTYYDLRSRLRRASSEEVMAFVENNPSLPVANLLFKRWLRLLGQRRDWAPLRKYYAPSASADLNCYYLRSLYHTGDKENALDQTTDLWLAPISQPAACDLLFAAWRATERFTQARVWRRFKDALANNQMTLARYLIRYLSGAYEQSAKKYYAVHVKPKKITQVIDFKIENYLDESVVLHGLSRLIVKDSTRAAAAWSAYQAMYTFEPSARAPVDRQLAVAFARKQGIFPTDQQRKATSPASFARDIAQAAVEQQRWAEAFYWIKRMPNDLQQEPRWQYWLARAAEKILIDDTTTHEIFRDLAKQRHYYGFLAAQHIGLSGRMNATTSYPSATALLELQRHPGLRRSIELFAVNDDLNGRREWYAALETMNEEQKVIAAELAGQLGLIALSIRTANLAQATDHLHLRFPLAFEIPFRRASMRTGLPTALLMAIARQESAMDSQARSPANARGLMQLLPTTARLVSRRTQLPTPDSTNLYDPNTNITLGSHHMAWLMSRYQDQVPLAAAAYNAGERRVDRWIKDAAGSPVDVWIETIPFRETRNYVKNVLAFRHVYGARLNLSAPMLDATEVLVLPL